MLPTAREKRQRFLIGILLAAATLVVFWQTGTHEFINYDDPDYVYENPYVKMGLTRTSLTWAFTTFHSANWHPLTWLSHMADVQLFGLDPYGHHISSLVLHTANVVLLFLLLCKLTGFTWRSMTVAALFAFHPLHVESVAWVAERKDVLSTFFWLGSLYFYACYAQTSERKYYLLMILAFASGLMAKPMLVTLPFLLMLLDFWPMNRLAMGGKAADACDPALSGATPISFRGLVWEKVPLLVLAGISGIVTLYAQHAVGAVKSLVNYPVTLRVANALTAYAGYLYKMLWPDQLAIFYPFPKAIPVWQLLAASGILGAITVGAVRSRRKRPYIAFGWFWYLGTLMPVIGLVQVGGQSSADRYTYVPLIGIFILLVWLVCDQTAQMARRNTILAALAALSLLGCTLMTPKQLSYWKDDVTLYSHALTVTHDNYVAHNNLGFALGNSGNYSEANRHFQEAIRISPSFADAYLNLGDNLLKSGDIETSIVYITRAIELRPNFAAAYNDLGVAMLRKGELKIALDNFNSALGYDPLLADSSYNKGIVFSMWGRPDEAIEQYARAIRLNPDNPNYLVKMGLELVRKNRIQEAVNYFTEALRRNPNDPLARQYLDRLSTTDAGNGSRRN